MHKKFKKFYHIKQDAFITDSNYTETFCTLVKVYDTTDCEIGKYKLMGIAYLEEMEIDLTTSCQQQQEEALAATKEQYLTITFLLSAGRSKYRTMIDALMNKFIRGDRKAFPINLTDANRNLVHWRGDPSYQQRSNIRGAEVVANSQRADSPKPYNHSNQRGNNTNIDLAAAVVTQEVVGSTSVRSVSSGKTLPFNTPTSRR